MDVWFYDVEVFRYDWTFVAKKYKEDKYVIIHNDTDKLRSFMATDPILGGFNSKFYDDHIVKGIVAGYKPEIIKEISDFIIHTDELPWNNPYLKKAPFYRFKSFDLMSDMQMGNSLKSIAGHLGLNILETSVDFDIDRPLTPEEIELTLKYNINDVDITEQLGMLRATYLNTKMILGKKAGLELHRSLYLTNAGLVAEYLKADKTYLPDGREIQYPDTLEWKYIPQELELFFKQAENEELATEALWKTHKTIKIQDMKVKYAWGGVHGAIPNYVEESTKDRVIVMFDVASLYPSIMIEYDLISRAVSQPWLFKQTKDERIELKKLHKYNLDQANKLVLNITYGASLLKSSKLYDERSGRSVCVSGQLLMTDLVYKYLEAADTVKLINFNTDGVLLSVHRKELPKLLAVNTAWEKQTRLVLEADYVKKIVQKDVNNYVMVEENGKVTTKGSYVKYGDNPYGSWSINNDVVVVKKALIEHFAHGTDYKQYIRNHKEIIDFQMIAKAGMTYEDVIQQVGDKYEVVQKVNRVYASRNKKYGTLFKVHKIKKAENPDYVGDKIPSIPDNCIIDNENLGKLKLSDIDLDWYIDLAERRVNDYLGIKKRGRK